MTRKVADVPEERKRRKMRKRWGTQEKEKKQSEEHWPVIKSATYIAFALFAVGSHCFLSQD
jgi:hypothetical protein